MNLNQSENQLEQKKFQTLVYEKVDRIGVLKISREPALNALNTDVIRELGEFLDVLDTDQSLRALIVTGAGEKAFVAGADIKELSTLKRETARAFARAGQDAFRRLEVLRIPVIAAVNGFALGGGLELALACDFIFASEKAKFGLPEVSLGLIPGFGGTQRLARQVGLAMAREMIYSGRMIQANEALQIGLVNRVVAPGELLAQAFECAKLIASRAPLAVAGAKQALNSGFDVDLDSGLEMERDLFSELFSTKDQIEGTSAFVEKRAPQFQGH